MTTLAPALRNASAVARPMPLLPPVISAIFPAMRPGVAVGAETGAGVDRAGVVAALMMLLQCRDSWVIVQESLDVCRNARLRQKVQRLLNEIPTGAISGPCRNPPVTRNRTNSPCPPCSRR